MSDPVPHSHPHLCVVGHPNKGKSSIVSTLTENDSVAIGAESGTTVTADRFDFEINGRVLLSLTDTPGFQRPRQVLAWLQSEAVSPGDRARRVQAFLDAPGHAQAFPDEIALLTPIMAGAGILYVVDGSQAVTPTDEAEMEILRWTGQPRMAIINPMDAATAIDEWERTLTQFFQWVRVFNPLTASLPARQALLRALGELTPGWSKPVTTLVTLLGERDRNRLDQVSESLTHYWCAQMTLRQAVKLPGAPGQQLAEEQLLKALDEAETHFFNDLRKAWGHTASPLEREMVWELDRDTLMNTETWYLWGLRERELLLASGSAGAATGFAVDLGLGGSSLLLGSAAGGVLGTLGGWLAARQLPGKRWAWVPLTRERQVAGPVRHPNFPLVTMARALTFTRQLWLKPHAERSAIALRSYAHDWTREQQGQLLAWSKRLQQDRWQPKHQDALVQWVREQLQVALDAAVAQEEATVWQSNQGGQSNLISS